jgi:hypothetical protein
MIKIKANAIIITLLSFISLSLTAQEFNLSVSMKGDLVQGQPFTVSYILTGGRGGDFAPPTFKGFSVSGPSSRSEYKNINGKSYQSYSLVYTLVPLKPGSASISSASIRIGNKRLRAEGRKFNILAPRQGSQESGTPFVNAEIPKDTFYSGEVIPLEYRLYVPYPYQKKGQRITIAPKYEGFFVENSSLYYSEELMIDGIRYTAYIIDRKYLYPHQSGQLTIPSITINYNLVHKDDRFGFFGSGGKAYTNQSKEKVITILPLPAPEPISFTGGVGDFSFEWETEDTDISTDDVFKVRLKIQGNGDLKSIKAPNLNLESDSFEVFPPKIIGEDRNEYRNGTLLSLRVYEYLITPLMAGAYKVPVDVCFFSPDSMDYINSPELSIQLSITQGDGLQFTNLPDQEETLEKKSSIQSLESYSYTGDQSKKSWLYHWSFWLILALPLGLTGGLWFNDRYEREYAEINEQRERTSKALQKADQEIAKLCKQEAASNTERFNMLNNIAYDYVSDKYGKGSKVRNIQSSALLLEQAGLEADSIKKLRTQLEENEMLAFGMPARDEFETYSKELLDILKTLD